MASFRRLRRDVLIQAFNYSLCFGFRAAGPCSFRYWPLYDFSFTNQIASEAFEPFSKMKNRVAVLIVVGLDSSLVTVCDVGDFPGICEFHGRRDAAYDFLSLCYGY